MAARTVSSRRVQGVSSRLTWLQLTLLKAEHPVEYHAQRDHPVIWSQINYVGPLLSWKGNTFSSLEYVLALAMDVPFLFIIRLRLLLSLDLQNALSTLMHCFGPKSSLHSQRGATVEFRAHGILWS